MALTYKFTGQTDTNLNNTIVLEEGVLYDQKLHEDVTATLDLTVPAAATFTFDFTETGLVDDDYNSVGVNLEFVNDDGDACEATIDDTSITSTSCTITFDATAAKVIRTRVADVSSNLTDAADYQIFVWTPTSASDGESGAYGKYNGYDKDINFEPTIEKQDLVINGERKATATKTTSYMVTGVAYNAAQKDVKQSMADMVSLTADSGEEYRLGFGSRMSAGGKHRLYLVYSDESDKKSVDRYVYGEFKQSGGQNRGEDGWIGVPWEFTGLGHPMYDKDINYIIQSRQS